MPRRGRASGYTQRRACGGVALTTASDIQAALDANPAGTTFCLAAGTYRATTNFPQAGLAPKANQVLWGANGAILNGAKELTGWTQAGSDWWVARPAGTDAQRLDQDRCSISGCDNAHDVFYDGAPLVRVTSLAALAPGKFFEDFAAGRVYVRDTPTGHTVEQAWARRGVISANAGIKVRNLTVKQFANLAQQGAIEAGGNNWVIEYCDTGYNHGYGIRIDGTGCVVRRNKIHHSMQMGTGGSNCHDAVVEYNEIHDNNRDQSYDPGWEAGGTKWTNCNRMQVRGNQSHHNKGIGLWWDIRAGATVCEGNWVYDNDTGGNTSQGIYYEISYGEATLGDGLKTYIRYNTCYRNCPGSTVGFYGGGQITVSASRDCEVYGNWVYGRDGIGGQAQLRTDSADARGAHEVRNLHIYANTITTTGGGWHLMGGIVCDEASFKPAVWDSWGNTYENNAYHEATGTGSHWDWHDGARSFSTWQVTYGNDSPQGSFDSSVPSVPTPPTLVVGPQP